MNIAIIDDSTADCQYLEDFIGRYSLETQLETHVTVYKDGESFLSQVKKSDFNLIFMDIYMAELDGIETAGLFRKIDDQCLLVFSTTSEYHAVKSFRLRAFDYLVKPYRYEQLKEVMQLCEKALCRSFHYIEVKESRILVRILLGDILYCDYHNHYIQIHTKTRLVRSYMSFNEFSCRLLSYPQFLCCYRNCLVNLDAVEGIDHQDFIMQDGQRMPIARLQQTSIRQRYADFLFAKMNQGS